MNRRHFIQTSLTGTAVGLLAPGFVQADTAIPSGEGSIYYTRNKPGRWAQKAEGHLPRIQIEKTDSDIKVKVITPHEMRGYEHYIIKHVLLDEQYGFIAEKLFDPNRDSAPVSEFSLKQTTGSKIHVLSLCNLHDLWLSSADL
jgi:superoxide reductase